MMAFLVCLAALVVVGEAQPDWKPADPDRESWKSAFFDDVANEVQAGTYYDIYPRPILSREKEAMWTTLNGDQWLWAADNSDVPPDVIWTNKVLVPSCIESVLSGVKRRTIDIANDVPDPSDTTIKNDDVSHSWYELTVNVKATWLEGGNRVILHFGAVDWETTLYINDVLVPYNDQNSTHRGGYNRFEYDITDYLSTPKSDQEVPVKINVFVYDPVQDGGQPVGKQRTWNAKDHIMYVPCTGIWQTVWMESVPPTYIKELKEMTTKTVDDQYTKIQLDFGGDVSDLANLVATVTISDSSSGGKTYSQDGQATDAIVVDMTDKPKFWTPDTPFLYDVEIVLAHKDAPTVAIDTVHSYVGLRELGLKNFAGVVRPHLNGDFVFNVGTLDQGYWPDGLYTAPTYKALISDVNAHVDLNMNTIRKHIKTEPDVWYHYCAQKGIVIWQDMPAIGNWGDVQDSEQGVKDMFYVELTEMVEKLRAHTAIVVWVVQNEGWGQHDVYDLAEYVKLIDPSRLVNAMSGTNCCNGHDYGNGDMLDWHIYIGPGSPEPELDRGVVLGEYGGLGYVEPSGAHNYQDYDLSGYGPNEETIDSYQEHYMALQRATLDLIVSRGVSASIYTEISDVEGEVNGFLTYDRKFNKLNQIPGQLASNQAVHRAIRDQKVGTDIMFPTGKVLSFQLTNAKGGSNSTLFVNKDGALTSEAPAAPTRQQLEQASFLIQGGTGGADPCFRFESLGGGDLVVRADDGVTVVVDNSAVNNQWCPDFTELETLFKPKHDQTKAMTMGADGVFRLVAVADARAARVNSSISVVPPLRRSAIVIEEMMISINYNNEVMAVVLGSDGVWYAEPVKKSDVFSGDDAHFTVRTGLADPSCYSFESVAQPGAFVRHFASRLRVDSAPTNPQDVALFHLDATWCAQEALNHNGQSVSFQSANFPNKFMRYNRFNDEQSKPVAGFWLTDGLNTVAWDRPTNYHAEASFKIEIVDTATTDAPTESSTELPTEPPATEPPTEAETTQGHGSASQVLIVSAVGSLLYALALF